MLKLTRSCAYVLCLLCMGTLPLLAEDFAIKISLGIVDDKFMAAADRIEYPLAFRAENAGKSVIKQDHVPDIFFKGTIQVLPADGKEQQAEVQPYWRTEVHDLKPGDTFDSPDYANLLNFFPGLKDGAYQVWWTREKLKSNVLRFTVTKGKLRLQQPKT